MIPSLLTLSLTDSHLQVNCLHWAQAPRKKMESEERQKGGRPKGACNKVTVAELEASVPTAPVLADFYLDVEGPSTAELLSTAEVPSTAVVLGIDEETDAAPLTSRDSSAVPCNETIERTDYESGETVENVVKASDTPGPGFGDMSRGLRQLEPHFFLSKVGVIMSVI